MTNATTGPVPGNPYAVIVLTGGFDVERFNYPAPVDALIAAVRYLRAGRQVRLTDRTCSALKETPDLEWVLDALTRAAADGYAPEHVATGPARASDGVPFLPPVSASGA